MGQAGTALGLVPSLQPRPQELGWGRGTPGLALALLLMGARVPRDTQISTPFLKELRGSLEEPAARFLFPKAAQAPAVGHLPPARCHCSCGTR